jgi:Kef-type K+ transport system membrane component KefB
MQQTGEFLFAIGAILMLGLATDFIGKRTFLPRVTLLLIFGIIVGDEVLGLIPENVTSRFELITNMALMMIGFLLGGKLSLKSLKNIRQQLAWISISAALGTTMLVTLALLVIGVPLEISILLGCIAAATAPAATVETVRETNSRSRFSRLLLAIVAIDDILALLIFSLGLALVSLLGDMHGITSTMVYIVHEIGLALMLGVAIGLPAAFLTGRLKPGQPMLTEALGLVFICGGAAIWLNTSFLIATMAMGAVITNLAKHHDYPFHAIENIEWPFMALFFLLAGASLQIGMLKEIGLAGGVYLLARAAGKILGAWLGARISHSDKKIRRWMGMALLPQAGLAIGMALLTANKFPDFQQTILSVVISTTVFFELVGPVLTRMSLKYARRARPQ